MFGPKSNGKYPASLPRLRKLFNWLNWFSITEALSAHTLFYIMVDIVTPGTTVPKQFYHLEPRGGTKFINKLLWSLSYVHSFVFQSVCRSIDWSIGWLISYFSLGQVVGKSVVKSGDRSGECTAWSVVQSFRMSSLVDLPVQMKVFEG